MKIKVDVIEVKQRKADNRGRVALGPGYAKKNVTVIVVGEREGEDE